MRSPAWPVLGLLLVGCGSGETKTETEKATPSGTGTIKATPEPQGDDLGKTFASGGIKLKVLSVRASRTLQYEGGTQSEQTPNAETRTIKAKQGGRYVYVKTRLTNDTSGGIDLTCSFPVDAKAVDDEGRQFDPDDGLSQIKGNPACNDMVQPGFKTTMTWVYLVPPGATVTQFAFSDVSDVNAPPEEPAVIAVPPTP